MKIQISKRQIFSATFFEQFNHFTNGYTFKRKLIHESLPFIFQNVEMSSFDVSIAIVYVPNNKTSKGT